MKRIVLLFLALSCLASCRLHDDYTGEPFIHLEYTVGSERFVFEDWGHIYPGFLSDSFGPYSQCSLYSQQVAFNQSIATLSLSSDCLNLYLESDRHFFTDGKRYVYKESPQKEACSLIQPKQGTAMSGWYSLTRKCTEPYCSYDVHFEFTCRNGEEEFEITDGILQVGRRCRQSGVKNFIKNEDNINLTEINQILNCKKGLV